MTTCQSFEAYKKNNHYGKPTIFVGGIPKNSDIEHVNSYLDTIVGNGMHNIITDSKDRLRGFAFIIFETKKEADQFLTKQYIYEGKVLDCKSSLDHEDYIASSLINIREPKKVFVDEIPKSFAKSDLHDIFEPFGEIDEIILIEKLKKPVNFAYVTFMDTKCAQKLCKKGTVSFGKDLNLPVVYARPKFSKKMLNNIPAEIRDYIRNIQRKITDYDPEEFAKIEDWVMDHYDIKDKEAFYNSTANSIYLNNTSNATYMPKTGSSGTFNPGSNDYIKGSVNSNFKQSDKTVHSSKDFYEFPPNMQPVQSQQNYTYSSYQHHPPPPAQNYNYGSQQYNDYYNQIYPVHNNLPHSSQTYQQQPQYNANYPGQYYQQNNYYSQNGQPQNNSYNDYYQSQNQQSQDYNNNYYYDNNYQYDQQNQYYDDVMYYDYDTNEYKYAYEMNPQDREKYGPKK